MWSSEPDSRRDERAHVGIAGDMGLQGWKDVVLKYGTQDISWGKDGMCIGGDSKHRLRIACNPASLEEIYRRVVEYKARMIIWKILQHAAGTRPNNLHFAVQM